jgi:pyruvate/2-oxoglutarate dehydrogenase complex dihydrolipoamide dehydrogenase (E3) component
MPGWSKPRRFDRNLVVIGAGSAGLVSAYIGSAVKARVTLVEQDRMGGDCLNTGCVPSKALIRSARVLARLRLARELGFDTAEVTFDFSRIMERVQRVIERVEPHDSISRYEALGVECLSGTATIRSPWSVEVQLASGETRVLTTRSIIIAAGARPFVPPIPGLREANPLTSETVWRLRSLPRRLLVMGGGPIGCELAQCFARFGADVTLMEMGPRLLAREDPEVSALVAERFRAEGMNVLLGCRAKRVETLNGARTLVGEQDGRDLPIVFDEILCAVGRVPNIRGYGLEALGIASARDAALQTNEYLQTGLPNIYACGDVAGPFQFTHTASHQAWYATVNALFGRVRKFKADYSVVPWATFTDPEVGRVGLNETDARAKSIDYEVTIYPLEELDRAIADEATGGFVKVLTARRSDRILGATVVGDHAGELIAEWVLAMRHGLGLNKLLRTIHVYPTFNEANKNVAAAWRRNHAPARLLAWLERYHTWMRR